MLKFSETQNKKTPNYLEEDGAIESADWVMFVNVGVGSWFKFEIEDKVIDLLLCLWPSKRNLCVEKRK